MSLFCLYIDVIKIKNMNQHYNNILTSLKSISKEVDLIDPSNYPHNFDIEDFVSTIDDYIDYLERIKQFEIYDED
jgi:hypothetical protein